MIISLVLLIVFFGLGMICLILSFPLPFFKSIGKTPSKNVRRFSKRIFWFLIFPGIVFLIIAIICFIIILIN